MHHTCSVLATWLLSGYLFWLQTLKHISGRDKWFPYDVSCNLIRSADHTRIHQDCEPHEDEWTYLIYLTPNWTKNDYGETAFYETMTHDNEIITEVRPKYGRAVVFQGKVGTSWELQTWDLKFYCLRPNLRQETACHEKLRFWYVLDILRKWKITAKFQSLKRFLIEDTKGFMSPEKHPSRKVSLREEWVFHCSPHWTPFAFIFTQESYHIQPALPAQTSRMRDWHLSLSCQWMNSLEDGRHS